MIFIFVHPQLPGDEFYFYLIFDLYDRTAPPLPLAIVQTSGRLCGEPARVPLVSIGEKVGNVNFHR